MGAQYSGNQSVKPVRRYFSGSTTLRKGQVLCYNEAASETADDLENRLGTEVEAVNTDNVGFPAGIVPDHEAGKVGPRWVELLQPVQGDILDVEVDGTTDVASGDILELDATLGALINGTEALGEYLFKALEAHTTDATKTAIKCYKL